MLRRKAVDRSNWPMMTTKTAASHKRDTWTGEVFPMQTNGNAGARGALQAVKEVAVSTVRSDGQMSNSRDETGDGLIVLGGHQVNGGENSKHLSGGRWFPQI